MDWGEYYEELARVKKHKEDLQEANPSKVWTVTSFALVATSDVIAISYTTDNQEGLLNLFDRCGIVRSINKDEYGCISSFTVETYNQQLVDVPYEDGSYAGHYTHLQRLE
jgi:hypothetical protein